MHAFIPIVRTSFIWSIRGKEKKNTWDFWYTCEIQIWEETLLGSIRISWSPGWREMVMRWIVKTLNILPWIKLFPSPGFGQGWMKSAPVCTDIKSLKWMASSTAGREFCFSFSIRAFVVPSLESLDLPFPPPPWNYCQHRMLGANLG